ncbi:hypothetical protein T265_10390 [Opisthorchis viverrini]|uniref:Uncharacterized protein n=1 Tax=Opisthorchis viverrini TaxID=6198 RepID=A0A074ZDF3_OPIVI|nr:hypothetical protein T265_10390 [Opisthorchis viverrini]KER21230.1 hypothetical protein T265_10390 [Opisthorchis viverrini]
MWVKEVSEKPRGFWGVEVVEWRSPITCPKAIAPVSEDNLTSQDIVDMTKQPKVGYLGWPETWAIEITGERERECNNRTG